MKEGHEQIFILHVHNLSKGDLIKIIFSKKVSKIRTSIL